MDVIFVNLISSNYFAAATNKTSNTILTAAFHVYPQRLLLSSISKYRMADQDSRLQDQAIQDQDCIF